jgi:hypothetical protein
MTENNSASLRTIKVNPVFILVAALGLFTVGAGHSLKALSGYDDNGWIVAQWLVVVGSVLIAIGPIAYLGTLKKRIGILAVILATLAALTRAAAEVPSLINIFNEQHPFWGPFFYHAVGASFLMVSLSVFSILWLKEERQSRNESNPELAIDLAFRTLAAIGVSTLMISINYFLIAAPGSGGRMPNILATVAPLIVVAVLTATFAQSSKFIGRSGLSLGILAFAVLGLSSLPVSISPNLYSNDTLLRFLGNGCEGIFHLLLALQLLFVMKALKNSHKS